MLGGDDLVDGVTGRPRALKHAGDDATPDERTGGDDVLAPLGHEAQRGLHGGRLIHHEANGRVDLGGAQAGAVDAFGLVGGQAQGLRGQRRHRAGDTHEGAHARQVHGLFRDVQLLIDPRDRAFLVGRGHAAGRIHVREELFRDAHRAHVDRNRLLDARRAQDQLG